MRKKKNGPRKKFWKRWLLAAAVLLLAIPLCVALCNALLNLTFWLLIYDQIYHDLKEPTGPGRPPELIETFLLPVNGDEPVLTQHKYNGWVNVTITGTIDLGEGRYHTMMWLCDAEGGCGPYRGLRIDGSQTSRYRWKRFSHDGYEFIYQDVGDIPRQISFQLITEDYPEASGALEVEVFYPWYSFNRGGGR
ncbi:MAG: hypothetical protein OXG78_16085 [Chloroflexi bacterium]|nr:hypothetical protein [Chloroflexota bacterium]